MSKASSTNKYILNIILTDFAISEDLHIVTMSVNTSIAACKSLFSDVVCCLPGIICAVVWCGIVLITADGGSTGCVQDGRNA